MPTEHARLSASSAHRWLHCPGSVKLAEQFPETGSSIYAEEGTIAHALAEALITKSAEDEIDARHDATIFYKKHPELGSLQEMQAYLAPYVEYIAEEYADAESREEDAVLMTEQRVRFSDYVPDGFGTADVILLYGDTLHIIDLKYGKGVRVEADDNPQLKLYALGALDRFDILYPLKTVKTTIYQPRLDHVSTAVYYADDLNAWGNFIVKPTADKAAAGAEEFSAGSWCKFCPARKDCKPRADYYLAMEDYIERNTLSPIDVSDILEAIDDIVAFMEDVKARALERALAGEEIAGYKVVEGRSVRKYSAADAEIVKRCTDAGYNEAMLYERKILTITAMEKLLGKKDFARILGDAVEKPPGKPTLAPITDKRPEIALGSAADDFADE